MRWILVTLLLCAGCSLEPFEPTVVSDAGNRLDAGLADAGRADAATTDAGSVDAATSLDAAGTDAGVEIVDAGIDAGIDASFDAGVDAGFDACMPSMEICNGSDEDCDGRIDEDVSVSCMNACGTMGTRSCLRGMLTGCTAPMEPAETCNGIDDDCNGTVDDPDVCSGCETRFHAGHTYLFCDERSRWTQARDRCRMRGYELVTIDDAAEDMFVVTEAFMVRNGDWWIGLNDRLIEGRFVWESGATPTYENWAPGQPNDFGGEDCVEIADGSAAGETRGLWSDDDCNDSTFYVCESP